MYSLFLDTSHNIKIGLLNSDFSWIDYIEEETKQASSVLHSIIYNLLEKNNIAIKDLEHVFTIKGPGSYTGLRLSEGIANIFEMSGIKTRGVYQFEVPFMVGFNKGQWASSAFKKQVFIYSWDGKNRENLLISEDEFGPSSIGDFFSFSTSCNSVSTISTQELVKNNPREIFPELAKDLSNKKIFYYRKLEDEFHVRENLKASGIKL